jgi:hypothetical protein
MGPVLVVLGEHAAYQVHLEELGATWAARPLGNDAEADPMHSSGARTFRVHTWLLKEGSVGEVQIGHSKSKPDGIT